jgi:hypothetical protein
MTEVKTFRTFIRIYSLFKSERVSINIKPNPHKALIRSEMMYTCAAWHLAAGTYLLKLQRLQNNVLRAAGNFQRCIPIRDLHTAFNVPHVYDYITKFCIQQAEDIQNHKNEHVRQYRTRRSQTENVRRLSLAVVNLTTVQVTQLPL